MNKNKLSDGQIKIDEKNGKNKNSLLNNPDKKDF